MLLAQAARGVTQILLAEEAQVAGVREAELLGDVADGKVGGTYTMKHFLAAELLHPLVWSDIFEMSAENHIKRRNIITTQRCQLVQCTGLGAVVYHQGLKRQIIVQNIIE